MTWWQVINGLFDYPLKLHHTQTGDSVGGISVGFDYPLKLHHTQTEKENTVLQVGFDYPLKLHHTQTGGIRL